MVTFQHLVVRKQPSFHLHHRTVRINMCVNMYDLLHIPRIVKHQGKYCSHQCIHLCLHKKMHFRTLVVVSHGGKRASRVAYMSYSYATFSSSSWGIPKHPQISSEISLLQQTPPIYSCNLKREMTRSHLFKVPKLAQLAYWFLSVGKDYHVKLSDIALIHCS